MKIFVLIMLCIGVLHTINKMSDAEDLSDSIKGVSYMIVLGAWILALVFQCINL